jgi:hypothetical protein
MRYCLYSRSGQRGAFLGSGPSQLWLATGTKLPSLSSSYLPWCFVLMLGWAPRVGSQDTGAPLSADGSSCLHSPASLPRSLLLISGGRLQRGGDSQSSHRLDQMRPSSLTRARSCLLVPQSCPSPSTASPRVAGATSWEAVDRLANKIHARYLVNSFGYPEMPKWDAEEFRFLRSLDMPEEFQERTRSRFLTALCIRLVSRAPLTPTPKRTRTAKQ